MLTGLHAKKRLQLFIGFAIGFGFGFLLQKGWVTRYDIIIAQLLLTDFTVLKVMLTALLTGMVGIHIFEHYKLVELHPKEGSMGGTVVGGLIFGVGFAVLGYCPGTVSGAAAQGSMDALAGGLPGILIGSWIFSEVYPKLEGTLLKKDKWGKVRIPELIGVGKWIVVVIVSILIMVFFGVLERFNL